MARSWTGLYPEVCSWQNLLLASRRCRRRKRYAPDAAEFDYDWESRLLQLQSDLASESWFPGPYRHFHISDPKPRMISAASFSDRVVHHAVVNVLEPIFEPRFVFDSYACRRGKGTHRAIDRAQYYLRRHSWTLKTDIVKFFPNVDHELLMLRLQRSLRDVPLLTLLQRIVDSGAGVFADQRLYQPFPGDDLFSSLRPVGLPIGNLTSQFLANVCLDPLDHFVKEVLRVPGYVRYCDDLVLFGDSRTQMWEYRDAISQYLAGLRLRLHPRKTHVAPQGRGVNFLGLRIRVAEKRVLSSTLRRFSRRMARLQWLLGEGLVTFPEIACSIRAWTAHCQHANSRGVVLDLLRRLRFGRSGSRSTAAARLDPGILAASVQETGVADPE
ncbi:MAG: reverse transcriptase domain-containing protein [Planctomyces sp.]